MNEYETIKAMLQRAPSHDWHTYSEKTLYSEIYFDDNKKEILFMCEDDACSLLLSFDENGRFVDYG